MSTAVPPAAVTRVKEISVRPWKAVIDLCKDAAVFVDDSAAELLQWAGGLELLDGCLGVYDMYKELNPVAKDFIATAPYSCVVFVVTSFLSGECSTRINHLLTDLQPLHCHVFTIRSEQLHNEWTPMPGGSVSGVEGVYSHFGEFQALLRKWINREAGVRVSVSHLPLSIADVCPGLFTTPTCSSLFPLLPSDLDEIIARCIQEGDVNCSLEHLGQVDFDMLTHPFKMELKTLAETLNTLLEGLDMREELFSLGYTARLVASQLAALPDAKARRKVASQKCSVLLVDRTLDLCGPLLHQSDTLVDRILSTHPHPTPTSDDVCVNVTPVTECGGVKNVPGDSVGAVVSGRLAQPRDEKAQLLLRSLVCHKQKESLMEVSRCLLDSLSQQGLSVKLTGRLARPSASQLRAFLQEFSQHPDSCVAQRSVLQLACAVVQALESSSSKNWDRLASVEKVLMSSASDPNSSSVLSQLIELVNGQESADIEILTLRDLLGLGVVMFSLLGVACVEKQREFDQFKESIVGLVQKWRDCDESFITSSLGIRKTDPPLRIQGQLSSAFRVLEAVGECRNELKQFKHIYKARGHQSYMPLLSHLSNTLFDASQPELLDVDFHSQGSMTNIIKSSFSLFMSSARPHPAHHPTLLLFVVGGVMGSEVKSILDSAASHKSQIKVLVGGTRLVTPDLLRMILTNSKIRS